MKRENFTYIKILCNLGIFAIVFIAVIFALPKLLLFFMPFVVAWLISCITTPIVRFVEKHLKLKRKMSMAVLVVLIIGSVVAALYGIGLGLARLFTSFLADLPKLWENMRLEAQGIFRILFEVLEKLPGDGMAALEDFISNSGALVTEALSNLSMPTISAVGNLAKQLPDIIIFVIMCLLATYFFVVEREAIHQKFHTLMPKSVLHVWKLIKRCLVTSIGGYFKAQFKIEVWIYLLIFIGLSILRVEYAVIIAVGIAALDLLPVFGTGAVLWPWTVIKLVNGRYLDAIGMMLIWGIAQLVRQFIQPKFVGETLGVAPIPTLFLLFSGYKISGVFGMILAVPLGILVVSLYQEGVFETAEQSFRLLIGRINRFRKFDAEELEEIKSYKMEEKKDDEGNSI